MAEGIKIIQKQKPMRTVLTGLAPAVAASVYYFGWRSLVLLFVVTFFGFLTEYIFNRFYNKPVTEAVFVTCFLFTLSLPPTLPYWMAALGIIFGLLFGKLAFGGFGRNVFNPALVGRIFLYINFGNAMTGQGTWLDPSGSFPAGLGRFTLDSISEATPLRILASGGAVPIRDLFLGNTGGCLGDTAAFLLILGGIYIVWKKVANYRIVAGVLFGFLAMNGSLWLAGLTFDPLRGLLAGGFLLGAFFMATDPISAAQTNKGRWLYGILIGILAVLIRVFSSWPEGIMFAILLGNMFAPIIDYALSAKKRKENRNA
jgi:Na+-transporting NADH:ubiquinone oxidoreductase subunit B